MADARRQNGLTVTRRGESGGSDEEQIERLRTQIALSRRRLDSSLHELEHRVSEGVDWRRRVAEHPWLSLATAVVFGYTLGRLGSPPVRDHERVV